MELIDRIEQVKSKALRRIEKAAKDGNIKIISHHTQVVQEADRLIEAVERISSDINSLERTVSADSSSQNIQNPSGTIDKGLSNKKKAHGKAKRREFIRRLQSLGIKLTAAKGVTIYKTSKRNVTGIAFARESADNHGHWFLGLPDQNYDFMVLLCEQENQDTFSLVLPKSFSQSYRTKFSKSGGQLKFHVLTDGDRYYIKIPNTDRIDVSRYLDDIDSLAN